MSLTRRNALRLSLAASLATLSKPAFAQDLTGKRVIVIGAGFSGLAAAQDLRKAGAEVIVLEATDKIGGRVRTDWSLGAPFEVGAGWIHGPSADNPTQQLAASLNAPTVVTDDDNIIVFDGEGYEIEDEDYEAIEELYEELTEILYEPRNPGSANVQDYLAKIDPEYLSDPISAWMLSAYFEFSIGAGIEDISAANGFASEAFPGADVVLTDGYDALLPPLTEGLDIRLGSPVVSVKYGPDGVEVDGETADYVVCTAPLGVLKAGKITFDPPLPDDLASTIESLGFGTVTKIALKFDEAFWDTETQYFGIMTETKGRWPYWLSYRTFTDENILLGLSLGSYAPVADAMSVEEMTEDAMEVLRTVWEDEVGEPTAVLTTHWSQEPYFLGAYSYPQAGGSMGQFAAFDAPVAGRVFFAGEHTSRKYNGTTHGALLTGRRAARAILKA